MPLSEHQRRTTLITNQLLPWQLTWTPFLSNNYVIIFCPRPILLWNTFDLKSVHKLIRIRSLMIPPQAQASLSQCWLQWITYLRVLGVGSQHYRKFLTLSSYSLSPNGPVQCVPTLGLPWGTWILNCNLLQFSTHCFASSSFSGTPFCLIVTDSPVSMQLRFTI